MRITLFSIGRLKAGQEADLAARYLDRLAKAGPAIGIDYARSIEIGESRAQSAEQRKAEEARELEKAVPKGAVLIALDERGKNLDSTEFAALLGRYRDDGLRDLVVAIGGPDGFDPDIRRQADMTVSFGKLTWPHQLIRIMLAEQLYRAVTILSGHPYHRN